MRHSILIVAVLGCLFLTAASTQIRISEQSSGSGSSDNSNLVRELLTAATQVDRINLLSNNSDFVFDFVNPPTDKAIIKGKGGSAVIANRATFPALTGEGSAMIIGFAGPCGLSTPHTHPRSAEISYSVNGTFVAGFIQENGARFVNITVNPGQAAFFPMGSIHYQANLGCDPVMFVAFFGSDDPGNSQIAQNFFGIDPAILSADLGGEDENTIKGILAKIPDNFALGLKECQKRCGISNGGGNNN
jgi:quercetin dioxygenase-like cupin family protein